MGGKIILKLFFEALDMKLWTGVNLVKTSRGCVVKHENIKCRCSLAIGFWVMRKGRFV